MSHAGESSYNVSSSLPLAEEGQTETTPLFSDPRGKRRNFSFTLTILFLIQLCEPITAFVIYPFVNQMVRWTGVVGDDEKKTGYFAGIIESLFFLTEGATVLLWQIASERFGRRPVLLLAPLGLGLSMLSFGWSKTFGPLVVSRGFQGLFNGDVGVTKTALAEITEDSNRAEIMALVPVIFSICIVSHGWNSPFIGGVFSNPSQSWPNNALAQLCIFRERPYLLPCLIAGVICFFTYGLAVIGLKETQNYRVPTAYKPSGQSAPDETEARHLEPPLINFRDILAWDVLLVLLAGGLFALSTMTIIALQALVWSTSIENGGLGFTSLTIGSINTIVGLPNALVQFLVLGRTLRVLGNRRSLIACFVLSLVALILYPVQTYLAGRAGYVDWKVWLVIGLQLCASAFIWLGYVEVSPNPHSTGIIQGLLQTTSVLMRGVSPTLSTSLFAHSLEHQNLMNGYLVYWILGIIDLVAVAVAFSLPDT
ncbi:major facilitator superfamily domain-containing protein [Flagelloscypha sp. PMI_526]|nr:major facilitator superfamily domain-containing protein [Flagelloscypha sp. PMI_526]